MYNFVPNNFKECDLDGSVLLILLVFCMASFVVLVFVLYLVYSVLPVSLHCPFMIAPLFHMMMCHIRMI